MKYETFIFDLDGTLVHTSPEYRYKIIPKTLEQLGSRASRVEIDKFWFGRDRDEIIRKSFNLKPETFWKVFRKYDVGDLRRKYSKAYEDVDFIKELNNQGYKTAIVTGAPSHISEMELDILNKRGIGFDVEVVAHTENGIRPKPDPHGLEECLHLLGVEEDRDKVVYIGNGEEDILAAGKAGIDDVLIDRGEHSLIEAKPSLTIQSLYELKKRI